jgi:nucleotide-binding universal stress UspA family protein
MEEHMSEIQQIIVPVDFHKHTNDLAKFAVDVANKLGAKTTFIHVVEQFAQIVAYSDVDSSSFLQADEELFGRAQNKMTEFIKKTKESCPLCDGVVLRGNAADSIVAYAGDQKVDMIIMGTHGAQGIEKILLGSVAERVLKRSSCPILIFNPYKGDSGYALNAPINATVQPV